MRRGPSRPLFATVCTWVILGGSASGSYLALSASPAAAATPDTGTTLPGSYSSMAIDPIHDNVFVSTPGSGSVEVLDFSGEIVKVISGLHSSTSDIANSVVYADGAVYVTDSVAGSVDEISTTTFALNRHFATGLTTPYELALAGGDLWTTTGSGSHIELVGIDPTSGQATLFPSVQPAGPGLQAGPGLPDVLYSYSVDATPLEITAIDVSSIPSVTASVAENGSGATDNCADVGDLSVSPDGTYLVVACGAQSRSDEIDSGGMLPTGTSYPDAGTPGAVVTTSKDGGLLAGGDTSSSGGAVDVYGLGDPTDLLLESGFDPPDQGVYPRGLMFSPGGCWLFVVSGVGDPSGPQFEVMDVMGIGGPPTQTPETSQLVLLPVIVLVVGAGFYLRRRRQVNPAAA